MDSFSLFPFGDSHTYFWGKQKSFPGDSRDPQVPALFWMGPAKAFGLAHRTKNRTQEKFSQLKALLEQLPGIPISCFGEIDIRVNLSKQFIFSGDVTQIVRTAQVYLQEISKIQASQIFIWGPPPSARDDGMFNPDLPAFGDNRTRNYVTHIFNLALLNGIQKYNHLRFATLFYDCIDDNLVTKPGVLYDGCHLSTDLQDFAKIMLHSLVVSGSKASFNHKQFQIIKPHKRVFELIATSSETPYIQLFKCLNGEPVEYFAYKPLYPETRFLRVASLAKLV